MGRRLHALKRPATAALALAAAMLAGCERYETLAVVPPTGMKTHWLVDFTYVDDPATGVATMGHLVVFNPGPRAAALDVTVYYEDREPARFGLEASPGASTESNYASWPVKPGERFALGVESSEPVVAQATIGWNNVGNDSRPTARARDGGRPREAATSYLAIPALAERWYLADGIVLDAPSALWVRESEWAVLLNPGDRPARVDLALFFRRFTREHTVEIAPRRVRAVLMDDLVTLRNKHYGVRIASDVPIAAQWRRTVAGYDSPEPMAFWSVPLAPMARIP
ncbi:MAG: hypothetical protein IT294_12230 [Deltaproteobacteria bacterium]|nr:hypothetical protein [Deltaproteobacteria bacterium]